MAKLKFIDMYVGMQENNRVWNVPSIFLEVPGCNLCCLRPDGKTCSKVNTIGKFFTTDDALAFINDHKEINHIVIKGGEPLMYKKELEQFLDAAWRDDMFITIRTNGTLPMLNPLAYNYRIGLYIVDLTNKNIPEAGTKVKINNNEIILGTTDIERMKQDNTKWLRELCMYSNDYLLYITDSDYSGLPSKAAEIVKRISVCGDAFIDSFFETHPVNPHVVFVGSGWNSIHADCTKNICINSGYMFAKPSVCGDSCAPM